jgi:hypothetical protein
MDEEKRGTSLARSAILDVVRIRPKQCSRSGPNGVDTGTNNPLVHNLGVLAPLREIFRGVFA